MQDIEESLQRIKNHETVDGYIITNRKGEIIKTSYTGDKKIEGEKILDNIPDLIISGINSIKNINENNELQFMRIKTKMYEILISTDKNEEYIFICIQNPNWKNEKNKNDNN